MQSQDEAESRAASTDDGPEAIESGADLPEVAATGATDAAMDAAAANDAIDATDANDAIDATDANDAVDDTDAEGAEVAEPADAESDSDAPRVTVRDSVTLGVAGGDVTVRDSVVGAMAAGNVEANDTFVVFGTVGSLEGDSRVLIDTRSAVLMGIAGGLVLAIAKWLLGGKGNAPGAAADAAAAAAGAAEVLRDGVPDELDAEEPSQVGSDDVG